MEEFHKDLLDEKRHFVRCNRSLPRRLNWGCIRIEEVADRNLFRHNRLIQGFNILTIFGGRGRIFVMGVLKFIRVKEQNCHKRIAKTYTNMTKDSTRYIKWTFLDSPHPYPKKKMWGSCQSTCQNATKFWEKNLTPMRSPFLWGKSGRSFSEECISLGPDYLWRSPSSPSLPSLILHRKKLTIPILYNVNHPHSPPQEKYHIPLRKCWDCGPKSLFASWSWLDLVSADAPRFLSLCLRSLYFSMEAALSTTLTLDNWSTCEASWSTSLWSGVNFCWKLWN